MSHLLLTENYSVTAPVGVYINQVNSKSIDLDYSAEKKMQYGFLLLTCLVTSRSAVFCKGLWFVKNELLTNSISHISNLITS